MKISEELKYRNLFYQTTLKNIEDLDNKKFTFYLGVDPSADSMTVGHLAVLMLAKHLIKNGNKAFLLIGGATGLIGDPDGKKQERELLPISEINKNKKSIVSQYKNIIKGQSFTLVDNYDWFKNMGYLEFLRDFGKKVPLRTMLGRDFVQSRIGEDSGGLSYAEFSYSLIQGYDFYHLNEKYGVNLQVSGADQWGNSIAGVDLTRRVNGNEVNVLSIPLIINKQTGIKFGKTEAGAVWLDPKKTSVTMFYQFWINQPDEDAIDFLKTYTMLEINEIEKIAKKQIENPKSRIAQKKLAYEVTRMIHGEKSAAVAQDITETLIGIKSLKELGLKTKMELVKEIPFIKVHKNSSVLDILVDTKLAQSKTEARNFLKSNAISINNEKISEEILDTANFVKGLALLRKGKAYRDSALIQLR